MLIFHPLYFISSINCEGKFIFEQKNNRQDLWHFPTRLRDENVDFISLHNLFYFAVRRALVCCTDAGKGIRSHHFSITMTANKLEKTPNILMTLLCAEKKEMPEKDWMQMEKASSLQWNRNIEISDSGVEKLLVQNIAGT